MLTLRSGNLIVDNPIKDKAAAEAYLKKELKIDLKEKQQTSLVLALNKPEEYLAARKITNDQLIGELADMYAKSMKKWSAYLPVDQAQEKATKEVVNLYESRVEYLEMLHPGYSDLAIASRLNNTNEKIKLQGSINTTNGEPTFPDKQIMKQYYKDRRTRHKAKKNKNKQ